MSGDGPDPTRDVAEWVRFLKDIGVREMHVSSIDVPVGEPVREIPAKEFRHETPKRQETVDSSEARAQATGGLAEIRERIGECTRCRLHERRTNIVFGVGSPDANLMFVGEGPGAEEDARGEPFVGRAGKKLDEMIAAIGLKREEVYIANIVKCRPPDNRTPQPDEVGTCSPFLFEQIAAIAPRVIVTLGSPSTKTLLDTKVGITKMRGIWHSYEGIPVMPTFHPAYLLRAYTPQNRRLVWEDLKAARARMDEGS